MNRRLVQCEKTVNVDGARIEPQMRLNMRLNLKVILSSLGVVAPTTVHAPSDARSYGRTEGGPYAATSTHDFQDQAGRGGL
jgi:hypothetical protein